jgi:NADH:ubiquinone reductase (H+-translocating)
MQRAISSASRPRIVIIGAGFAGLTTAKALRNAAVDLIVIDRHNYHLFQPLLYQVATAGLSPADIAAPIRQILSRQTNTTVMLADVSGVDVSRKEVIAEGRRISFDKLIIATGAQHAYFGHDEWSKHAPGLKSIDDATYVRRRILLAFEKAETETDEDERRRLLNFVVVGAGPTGVEMAGAIAELAKKALARDFRTIDPAKARIILIEAGPRVLPPFDPSLATAAQRGLEKLGVEVRLGGAVTACDELGVVLGDERIDARTIIWAAGVMASPAGKWLNVETDRSGRVIVGPDLGVLDNRDIFVLGDTACVPGPDGKPLPGIAPVAKAQGNYVAERILAELEGRESPPFRYSDLGSLATIGRKSAVIQIGRLRLTGFIAWLIWSVAHIYFLIGFRNRLSVVLNWAWNYFTFQRGARLITGLSGSRMDNIAPPAAPSSEPVSAKDRIRGTL